MPNHRLIVDSGATQGAEYPIPETGLNFDGDGITTDDPIWRIELRGDGAVLINLKPGRGRTEGPLDDGEGLVFRHVSYIYRCSDRPLDGMSSGETIRGRNSVLLSEEHVLIGSPHKLVEFQLLSMVAALEFVRKARRWAALLSTETADGFLEGCYSRRPFHVERSAIAAAEDNPESKFLSEDGKVCCIAIPEPQECFLYAEAGNVPFDIHDFDAMMHAASIGCAGPWGFKETRRKSPNDKTTRSIPLEGESRLPGTIIRIAGPGTTFGPGSHENVPISQRRFIAPGIEILRKAVLAVEGTRNAAVIFTHKTPYGWAPEFWFPAVFETSPWMIATALKGAGPCSNPYRNIFCVGLRADSIPVGVVYVESWVDETKCPGQLATLIDVANSSLALVRDVVEAPCEIIGHSPAIQRVREFVAAEADKDTPVLIEGPKGSGKTLVARAIHRASRGDRPFLWEFCGAPVGRYSTMDRFYGGGPPESRGPMERADGGTIYLKEIEALDLATQAELVRFLREGTFFKPRDPGRVRRSKVRVIASASINLEDAVSDGRFLEDLYLQLAPSRIRMPAIAEHREDIPLIAAEFLQRDPDLHFSGITPEAMDVLKRQHWNANLISLECAIHSAAHEAKSEWIDVPDLLKVIDNFR